MRNISTHADGTENLNSISNVPVDYQQRNVTLDQKQNLQSQKNADAHGVLYHPKDQQTGSILVKELFKDCENCQNENVDPSVIEDEILDAAEALLELKNFENHDKEDTSSISLINMKGEEAFKDACSDKKVNLMNLIKNDEDLIAFTGVPFSLLNSLTEAVTMCEEKLVDKRFSNSVRDRIVLCLCKLRLNLSFKCLAVLFNLTRQSCSNNFFYMVELLSKILKKVIYWPTDLEIKNSLPKCFKNFQNTKVILDCTEIPVEKPRCLKCRLRLYSHYKGCETIKLLIGIAPNGLLIFKSDAYGGRASDKAIFNDSNILNRVEPTRDAIMVDKGFDIEVECLQNYVELIMPPKLKKNELQQSAKNVALTNSIAAARVHVERSIQRFKMFKIVNSKIS